MQTSHRSFLFCVVTGLLALVFSGCSADAKKARHLAEANRHYDAGQYDEAEIEYKNVLQLGGENPQAIARLGLIYFDQGRVGRSYSLLLKGHELLPNDNDLRLKLGQIYLATGKPAEARAEAVSVLEKNPQDPDAPLLLVDTANPNNPKEMDEIRNRLKGLPPAAAAKAPAIVALGVLDFRERKFTEAEAAFQRALTADPKSSAAQSALAFLYRVQNNLPKAEQAYAAAAAESPARSPKRLQYAQFKLQTGDVEGARKLLDEMIQKAPDYLPALVSRAEMAASEKKYAESEALIAKVLARDALQPEAMLLSGRLALVQGDNAKAISLTEKMLKSYPQSAQGAYQLGVATLANGETDKAILNLKQASLLSPGFIDPVLLLANVNLRKGDYGAVIVAMKQTVQARPDLVQAWLLLADAYRRQNNLSDALAVYRQMDKLFPRSAETPLLTGMILRQQNKKAEARQAFDQALEIKPDYLPALEQLVYLDIADQQFPAARKRVQTQIEKYPKETGLYLLLARIYTTEKDNTQAEVALKKAIELQPDSPTPYYMLANIYFTSGEYPKALANLSDLLAKNPKDVQALMLTGVLYDLQKQYAPARENYEKLLAINPDFSPALNNLAYLYSERFNLLDKAYETAQHARELLPQEPHTADTLGWILYKRHDYPRALSFLQDSAEKLPEEAEVQFHVGMTHYMMGEEDAARDAFQRALKIRKDFTGADEATQRLAVLTLDTKGADARAALEKTVAAQPGDPVALARLASVYEREGTVDKSIATYQKALEINPANVEVMLGLIRLNAGRKDTAKAFELAKAARKVAPEDPDVARALGRLAFQTGDYQWASNLLQQAVLKQPDDPSLLYDLALSSYSVGRVDDAVGAARRALELSPTFPDATKARHFMDFVALSADPAQAADASAKIEQAVKTDATDVPALMALGALDEQKQDSGARQIYEKVLTLYPDFSPAKKRLAIIYAATPGDNAKAYEMASKARTVYPNDADVAKALGIIMYRQNDFDRAATLLKESASKRPTDAELHYYLGMAQYRLKRTNDSRASLRRSLELHLKPDLTTEANKVLAELK
jgi:tetratricopeptide (TPR) repeat protein